jgi:hypothetical protein
VKKLITGIIERKVALSDDLGGSHLGGVNQTRFQKTLLII